MCFVDKCGVYTSESKARYATTRIKITTSQANCLKPHVTSEFVILQI